MEMCEVCEFAIKKDTTLVCGKCGCWMQAKVKVDASKCPVGKW
jgi:transcription initiation factor TFIIIB Brf1 subunit/transcription initiation factor TFIIB